MKVKDVIDVDNITRNSTLHDVEQAHRAYNLKKIAFMVGIGEQKLKRILTFAGFEYDASIKKWRYVLQDEKNDARDFTVYQLEVKIDNNEPLFPKTNDSNDSNFNDVNEFDLEKPFTIEEIIAIKQLAARHMNKQSNNSNDDYLQLEAIRAYQINDVDRRTYAIDSNVSNQLDDFCNKYALKKSQVLSLALAKFMESFE